MLLKRGIRENQNHDYAQARSQKSAIGDCVQGSGKTPPALKAQGIGAEAHSAQKFCILFTKKHYIILGLF